MTLDGNYPLMGTSPAGRSVPLTGSGLRGANRDRTMPQTGLPAGPAAFHPTSATGSSGRSLHWRASEANCPCSANGREIVATKPSPFDTATPLLVSMRTEFLCHDEVMISPEK